MPEEDKQEDLKVATREMRNNLWVDSLWQTYQESIDLVVPDEDPAKPGKRITRKLSIGMSVKSDNRAPSSVLHFALSEALNIIMEEEKEKWLDSKVMEQEIENIKSKLSSSKVKEEVQNGGATTDEETEQTKEEGGTS